MSRILLSLLVLLCAAGAAAQGVLTRAPELTRSSPPVYPPGAAAAGVQGEVVLELDVGADGAVLDARVVSEPGHGLGQAAADAALSFVFTPAEIDGKPAAVTIEYRTTFALQVPQAAAPPDEREEPAPAPVNLAGVVLERGTKKPVAGAAVDAGGLEATTDAAGRFELAGVPEGEAKVAVVSSAHLPFETTETIAPGERTEVTYYVHPRPASPFHTVVTGKRVEKEVAQVRISVDEVNRLPGTFGDAVRVVQNLPGAARQPVGSGELVLRGGDPHDTRVYVDGQWVPIVFHFGGLTSVYSTELIEDVEFEPGLFGARYGRATGGRIEIKSRDPQGDRLHLVADADLFDATALVEGPLAENLAGAFAVRRSYADFVLQQMAEANPDDFPEFVVAPRYWDFQAKLAWKPSSRDTLRLSLFGSDDELAMIGIGGDGLESFDDLSNTTSFTRLSLGWSRRLSSDTRLEVQVAPGVIDSGFEGGNLRSSEKYTTIDTRVDVFHDVSDRLTLGLGVDSTVFFARAELQVPGADPPGRLPPPTFDARLVRATYDETLVQTGVWTEASWKVLPSVTLVPGLRFDHDSFLGEWWVDPRFAARWAVTEATTLKGGVGLYHQVPPLPYITEEFGNPDLAPEAAVQSSLGVEQRLGGPLSVEVQVYYKHLYDRASPTSEIVERDDRLVPLRYTSEGTGRAYGTELLLRWQPDGRYFGWIAYSYGRTERDDEGVGGLIAPRGDEYEQPHNLIAVGTWELPEIWDGLSFGYRLRYTSGNPYRRVLGSVYDADGDEYRRVPEDVRSERMPAFFSADLRLDKRFTFDTWVLTTYLDVQNVTNRQNREAVAYSFDYSEQGFVNGLPIFPSLGLRVEY